MTLEDAKAYLRLESGGEDALVARLVGSAVALCEAYLGAPLVERDVVETIAPGAGWRRLGNAPVVAITEVADAGGVALPADAYAIDIDARGDGWVRVAGGARVRVTYRAGLAVAAEAVPAAIAQGVIRLAAHLYAARDGDAAPPAAVAALWRPYRRLRLGGGGRA